MIYKAMAFGRGFWTMFALLSIGLFLGVPYLEKQHYSEPAVANISRVTLEDGDTCVVYFDYEVAGQTYGGTQFIENSTDCPTPGGNKRVLYDPNHPEDHSISEPVVREDMAAAMGGVGVAGVLINSLPLLLKRHKASKD